MPLIVVGVVLVVAGGLAGLLAISTGDRQGDDSESEPDIVRIEPLDSSSPTYEDPSGGYSIKYPSSWQAISDPASRTVTFLPKGANPTLPGATIYVAYRPDLSFERARPLAENERSITVDGLEGHYYEDSPNLIPTYGGYIEIPFGDGILDIGATKGPSVNLMPQLMEMLKTFEIIH